MKNEGIICEGGNGGRQEAGKTHTTSHPRSASIQGSGIDEGEKPWRRGGIKLSSVVRSVKVPGHTETVER